ncbi:hypothetical protein EMIHUDRAFT_240935 [Emiliania huxleyi CCMP1516]|uniref:Uncharacterized protein n=2 Tax=Emiliania huxleyi TaxID=2903 RepID=A0A0D3JE90_EMIH1|nr:hypothetical protein EMIHUDRAFT_240935 [Emiliania huxleyi CCMP1516]EOD21825.1 hypothetical protein EMIHUDRAFT_240935 [Emiliania huxleyi CCMP1516]|eukprot:XP_005774254.1 hypothetical protein EMIHUDRAFT_240935 [Emiliania huxleyi CCMP1516]
MRLVSSKREPMRDGGDGITLADGQEWHLFLSHVWSTGQVDARLKERLAGETTFLDGVSYPGLFSATKTHRATL